jgi:hypothetical protein
MTDSARDATAPVRLAAAGLSCYTASLITLLQLDDPGIDERFRRAVRLRVRTDSALPRFSQHERVDLRDGSGLGYTGAADWPTALPQLTEAVEADGTVIAVADASKLSWSPLFGAAGSPHWVLLSRAGPGWSVLDPFEARLPEGVAHATRVVVTGTELARLLSPAVDQPAHLRARDEMALGRQVSSPPSSCYRWLRWTAADEQAEVGQWTADTGASLAWIAQRIADEPELVALWQQDLWAAARHHEAALEAGSAGADNAERLAAWAELPRAMRFAADSAARGRPRPGLVQLTIHRLADLETLDPDEEAIHA